ncbi:hypothetical protein ASD04_02225 [Devosia sp. Root436]|jgi:hypothetical protein|nr:hypothetical protein ASD04_02225 [Devosia sp. Root436]
MFFRVQRKNGVRGAAPSHALMLKDSAAPLIRPSGTFSLKGRREKLTPTSAVFFAFSVHFV